MTCSSPDSQRVLPSGQTIASTSMFNNGINTKKMTRVQLSKLPCDHLAELCQRLSKQVALANAQLVELLIDKDALHMQRDSILVDIQDLRCDDQEEDLSTLVKRVLEQARMVNNNV